MIARISTHRGTLVVYYNLYYAAVAPRPAELPDFAALVEGGGMALGTLSNISPLIIRTEFGPGYLEKRNSCESAIWH